MAIVNDSVFNLINNGIISGSLAFANTSKETDISLVKLYNNSKIEGKNNEISKTNINLDIYNAKLADITADNIKVNNIYNYGTITVSDKLKYDSFTNKGRLIFLGAKTLTLANSFNNNSGTIYATKIKCIDDEFINNGNIYTHQLGANILVNQEHGLIVVDNIYSKNIRIVNNGILQVRYLSLTKNIINHATLEIKNILTLMNNIANSSFLNANQIDGNNHILTNKNGILSCNILNNIRVVHGVVIVKQAIIGTNNIDNLKINYQVNQNGTLKVNNNIEGLGEITINGMAKLKNVSVKSLTNNSKTLTIGVYHNKSNDSSIDNKGKINVATINGCGKIVNHRGATIIANKLQNVICENEGRLVVKEKVKDIKVKGAIILDKNIKQIGFLDVEDLKADDITITGKVTVKKNANVSKLINTNIMRVDKKLIITSNKESINKRKLIVGELIISRGKLTNTNTGDLEVIGTNPVSLSDINFLNTGTAKISEVALKGDFTNYGNLTVYTVKNNNNVFKNKGNLYVKRGIILNDKFVNAGFVDISIANVSDSFTNSGTMIVQTLKGKISQVSTFINKAIADVYELQNIKIKNLANFKLADTISGKVEFTGILKLTGDIKQDVRSFCILDKIELASQEINYTISEKAYASFREAVKNDNLKIINYGVLSVDSGSKFKSYTSNGGVLNIWLTDTDITNAPLVRLQRAEFNTSKAPSSIVLRAAVVSENMLFSSTRVVKILQAENILYNGNIIANGDLFDLLAIQKVATNKFKQSIKAESILLKIDSPLIVKEYNAMYITANLSWYNVEDISILEDKPYSLNLIKSLHKDGLGAKTSSLQAQIKKNIYNNKLPEEALHVSEHILNIISAPGATKNQVKLKALAKNNFINLLSQIFPDNSLGAALTCASFSRTAFVDISKRLVLDRVIGYHDKFSSKNRKKTRKNYWGINTGSSYLDLCLWSSASITKYIETKKDQYAHNVWNSQTFSFGIDDKLLNATKVGLMLSYIHSSLINKSIINTDNHNAALNTFLQSIYTNYQFPRVLLNVALLNANTSHEQHNTSTLATRYVSKYKTHILGFMSEFVYPYSLKNMKLEFVEMVKFNSIFIPKYSSSDFETKSSQRVNIFSVGFATNFYYNLNINETSNINFLCSLLGYYSFNNTKNSYIKINYFNKDFSIKQRPISSYDISVDIATNINLNKVININLDITAGMQKNSRFIGAKFYINYIF